MVGEGIFVSGYEGRERNGGGSKKGRFYTLKHTKDGDFWVKSPFQAMRFGIAFAALSLLPGASSFNFATPRTADLKLSTQLRSTGERLDVLKGRFFSIMGEV